MVKSEYGAESVVVFSDLLSHAQEAGPREVISAGFIHFFSEPGENNNPVLQAHCYGESVSLNIKSRNEVDSKLATPQLFPTF